MNALKDWKTTIAGLLVGLPILIQNMGISHVGHVGNIEGGWLGVVSGIAAIFLGAFSNSKGQ